MYADPHRPPQCRHHRSRRPRQNHTGRRHAPTGRTIPRARRDGRPGDGLHGPGAGKGHHHPRQEHGDQLQAGRRRAGRHQHHRHPRSRRLRRRGRARPHHGRRRGVAGRRVRGPAAADPLRAPQGAAGPPPDHPGDQQGGPSRRADQGGRRRHVRVVLRSGRRRVPDRVPDHLRLRPRRRRLAHRARRRHRPQGQRQPRAVVHHDPRDHPGAHLSRGRSAAGARGQPGRVAVPRPARPLPGARGHHPQRPDRGLVPHRRHGGKGAHLRVADDRGPRA